LRAQSRNALAGILQGALHVTWRGASWDVVQSENLGKSETGLERRVKAGMDHLQVGERQFLQITPAFHG
jgi:hypothetical protein